LVAIELALGGVEGDLLGAHLGLGLAEVLGVGDDLDLGDHVAALELHARLDLDGLEDARDPRLDLDLLPGDDRAGGHRLLGEVEDLRRLGLEDQRLALRLAPQEPEGAADETQEGDDEHDGQGTSHGCVHSVRRASIGWILAAWYAGMTPARAPNRAMTV